MPTLNDLVGVEEGRAPDVAQQAPLAQPAQPALAVMVEPAQAAELLVRDQPAPPADGPLHVDAGPPPPPNAPVGVNHPPAGPDVPAGDQPPQGGGNPAPFAPLECDCEHYAKRRSMWEIIIPIVIAVLVCCTYLGAHGPDCSSGECVYDPTLFEWLVCALIMLIPLMVWSMETVLVGLVMELSRYEDWRAVGRTLPNLGWYKRRIANRWCVRHQMGWISRRYKCPLKVLAIVQRAHLFVPRTVDGLRSIKYKILRELDDLCEGGDELSALECYERGVRAVSEHPILDTALLAVYGDAAAQVHITDLNGFYKGGAVGSFTLPTK